MAPDAEICLSFIFYISALKLSTWLAITLRNKCHQTIRGRILKLPFQVCGFENWQSLQVWMGCVLWIPKCYLMPLWFLEFHLVKHLYTFSEISVTKESFFPNSLLIRSDNEYLLHFLKRHCVFFFFFFSFFILLFFPSKHRVLACYLL